MSNETLVIIAFIILFIIFLCWLSSFKDPEEIKNQKLIKNGYKYYEYKTSCYNSYINIIDLDSGYFKDLHDLKLFVAASKKELTWFREFPNK